MVIVQLRCVLVYGLLTGWLSACTERQNPVSPDPTADQLQVKSITQELPASTGTVSAFSYDAQNRLQSITTYPLPDSSRADIERSMYQYDKQSRLIQMRRELVGQSGAGVPNLVEQYNYTHNATGQVAGLSYLNGFALTLTYTATNLPTSSNRIFSSRLFLITETDTLIYTGNNVTGLRIRRGLTTKNGSEVITTAAVSYTYDDKVNPFYGWLVIPAPYPEGFVNLEQGPRQVKTYFGGLDNVLNLSQNNPLTESSTFGGTVRYQYQYNTASLPTLRITQNPATNQTLEVLRFTYESKQ